MATTTTKALVVSGAALVLAGGFVALSRKVVDEATLRAAFRPLVGTWKGTTTPPGERSASPVQLDLEPQNDGRDLKMTIRFAAIHQGDRKTLAIDPRTGRMRLLENGKEVDYRVEGLDEVAARGRGRITFVGPPATAKGLSQTVASLDVEGDHLTMRQELRPFGEARRVDEIRLERSR